MRSTLAFLLASLAAVVFAQAETTDILIGGSIVGKSVWEEQKDGSFKSDMSLSIQGITIESSLSGRFKEGILVEFDLTESRGATKGRTLWKGGKLSAWQGEKEVLKEKEFKIKNKSFFTSYHIQMWKTVWNELEEKVGNNELEVINLSSFSPLKVKFERRDVTVQLASDPQKVTILRTDVGGVGIEAAFDENGKPLGMNVPVQSAQFVLQGYSGVFVDPLSNFPELSQPTFKINTMTRVRTPMRDGVKLMSEIARPDVEGKYPTILIRTPYGRKASMLTTEWYAKRGYIVMVQDVRGRGGSDGQWDPLVNEKADGKDTLDWIISQPWSDGNVGMIGGSYLGYVQWAAASTGHPALKCIIPQVSPPPPNDNFPWDHGAFMLLPNIWWSRVVMERDANTLGAFENLKNLDALKTLPVGLVDDKFFGRSVPFFDHWIKRTMLSDWKDVFTLEDVRKVQIPVMHISGVWDGDGVGTMEHWAERRKGGGNQWVVFGPWTHLFNISTKMGDVNYGSESVLELDSTYLRFFDSFLKEKEINQEKQPRVKFFVTGLNKWIEGTDWPLPTAKQVTYYLGGGNAVGSSPQGTLTAKIGSGKDSYIYDPNNVDFKEKEIEINPSGGSIKFGKERLGKGTLIYQSAPLEQTTVFAGPATIELYITTSAKDATFHAMVLDVDEKGEYTLAGLPGTMRATHREGKIVSLVPGKGYKVTIEPWWFAREFAKGHRLAIMVYSDAFPQFARNPGTGEPEWKAMKYVKATHSIWKDKNHPSKVTLWTIPP